MIDLNSFEVYVIGTRSRYDRATGSCFIADFGDRGLEIIRRQYEAHQPIDSTVAMLKRESEKLERVFASQAF